MPRKWESIIVYEDRAAAFHTSRWRLEGIRTRQGGQNTDDGILWLAMSRAGDTVTARLYKSAARQEADEVASGSADASGLDGTPAAAVELTLSEAHDSGLSGSFFLHRYLADGACPLQAALCVDEDLQALWDGVEHLSGYDATAGCAEFIRLATEDVLAGVAAMLRDSLGGHGAAEAWFIRDAAHAYPDLRRIANPAQLRLAAAHRALEIAVGRSHRTGGDSMYSRLRDYHRSEYDRAMASLVLAVRAGEGGADSAARPAVVRQCRV